MKTRAATGVDATRTGTARPDDVPAYSRELRVGADVERLDLAHPDSHGVMGRCPCCGAVVVAALDTKHVTHLFDADGWRHKCPPVVGSGHDHG